MNLEQLRKEKERLEEMKEKKELEKEIFELKHGKKVSKAKSLGSGLVSALLPKSAVKGDLSKLKCVSCEREVATYIKDWKSMECKHCGGVFEQTN